jgi:dihydrofolate reductase
MKAIFATASNGGFGYKGRLPWPNIKEDLQMFKKLTLNNYVIMGYKTFSTIPNLPNRTRVVISRNDIEGEITLIKNEKIFENLIKFEKESLPKECFLIGGSSILSPKYLEICSEIYHTSVFGEYEADVYIPDETLEYLNTRKSEVLLETDKFIMRKYSAKL